MDYIPNPLLGLHNWTISITHQEQIKAVMKLVWLKEKRFLRLTIQMLLEVALPW